MIIIGFRKAAEALHHEAGEALRDRMLAEFHKITSPVITREEYGKPAVREKIPFSVSHSGDIVICAMGAEGCADLPKLRSGEEIAEGFPRPMRVRAPKSVRHSKRYRTNVIPNGRRRSPEDISHAKSKRSSAAPTIPSDAFTRSGPGRKAI